METPALDYFKYAAQAFGAVARPTIKAPGVNENGFFLGGVQPVVKKKVIPPKPQPMPGSGSTEYKITSIDPRFSAIDFKIAVMKPTSALLNPTSMGAKNFMPGAEKHLEIQPTSNVRPETKPDVPGSVSITRPGKAASALEFFAATKNAMFPGGPAATQAAHAVMNKRFSDSIHNSLIERNQNEMAAHVAKQNAKMMSPPPAFPANTFKTASALAYFAMLRN